MTDVDRQTAFEELVKLVGSRRTNLAVDREREVPDELIDRIVDLVRWAPNHKRTWPWEAAWVTGDGRRRLGDVAAEAMAARGDSESKVAKARTKYLRAPGMLVIASAAGDSNLRTAENRDSAAAGVQNALLGATSLGLATFWSSCPKGANDAVAELCGFSAGAHVVALIYVGWPIRECDAPARPPLVARRISS